jgi:hypothetical protein
LRAKPPCTRDLKGATARDAQHAPTEGVNPVLQDNDFLARKLSAYAQLTEHEQSYLAELQFQRIRVARGKNLAHQGELGQAVYILRAGWACSYRLLPNGGRALRVRDRGARYRSRARSSRAAKAASR